MQIPPTATRLIRTEKEFTLSPGETKKIIDTLATGILESILVSMNNQKVSTLLDIDGQVEEYKAEELNNFGLLEYVPDHFYLEKYDTVTPLFVIAYFAPNGDPYFKKLRFEVRNHDTVNSATVHFVRMKRWNIKEYKQ